MNLDTRIHRFTSYYSRHGFRATIQRVTTGVKRTLFSGRSVLFYCELSPLAGCQAEQPSLPKVERKTSEAELDLSDFEALISVWNPKLARRNIKERFDKGACLWLTKSAGKLAGYGWTLQGKTIEPHYLRLAQNDVHLFDFHVFPQYRGQGLNPGLVMQILCRLALESPGRAFIEAAEWNRAQLSSLAKTPFRVLGIARKMTIYGYTIVCWSRQPWQDWPKNICHSNSIVETNQMSRMLVHK